MTFCNGWYSVQANGVQNEARLRSELCGDRGAVVAEDGVKVLGFHVLRWDHRLALQLVPGLPAFTGVTWVKI